MSAADAGAGAEVDAETPPRRPRDWLREQRGLPRRRLIVIGSIALVLFLVFSVLLARYLSAENVERADIFAVLKAEAAGNADGVISHLSGCRKHAGCVAQAEQNAAKLRRSGSVKILTLSSGTAYAVTSDSGTTRVAWTVLGRLPTVQCVSVSRKGNFLSGLSVTLTGLSAPIPNEADC
ncbi:MAG TPA: hypothetical protein VHS55_02600 [Solirubrobacteraceae bacterium]|nr:hypothetical protein [Solirubrobacteraceae bacterium]